MAINALKFLSTSTPNAGYPQFMGKSASKSIKDALEAWGNLTAADGCLVPKIPQNSGVLEGELGAHDGHMVPDLPPVSPSVITRVQRLNTTAPAPAQARRA
jgi:hypothetical protein